MAISMDDASYLITFGLGLALASYPSVSQALTRRAEAENHARQRAEVLVGSTGANLDRSGVRGGAPGDSPTRGRRFAAGRGRRRKGIGVVLVIASVLVAVNVHWEDLERVAQGVGLPLPGVPAATAVAEVKSTTAQGLEVVTYFGPQREVQQALSARGVQLNQSEGFAEAYPNRCAEGVVVGPVTGTTATVFAAGLGAGWSGIEWVPSDQVSANGGLVHQQFVSPPETVQVGSRFDASAVVVIDGVQTRTDAVSLEVLQRTGNTTTWRADGKTITCDVTIP